MLIYYCDLVIKWFLSDVIPENKCSQKIYLFGTLKKITAFFTYIVMIV